MSSCGSGTPASAPVPAGKVVVSQGGLDQLRALQRRFRERGIESELLAPSGGGCGSS